MWGGGRREAAGGAARVKSGMAAACREESDSGTSVSSSQPSEVRQSASPAMHGGAALPILPASFWNRLCRILCAAMTCTHKGGPPSAHGLRQLLLQPRQGGRLPLECHSSPPRGITVQSSHHGPRQILPLEWDSTHTKA